MVENVFEYYDPLEHKKAKSVAIKMCKSASIWWENLKRQRERDGKKNIQTWEKMKKELNGSIFPLTITKTPTSKFKILSNKI